MTNKNGPRPLHSFETYIFHLSFVILDRTPVAMKWRNKTAQGYSVMPFHGDRQANPG
jgi:hypothetical protein